MDIVRNVTDLRARLKSETTIGFVPTMGSLHAGHIDLMRVARERIGVGGCVAVSIFVNRLQFGPAEDFGKYPRVLEEDCEKCRAAGVDVVFAPDEAVIYPQQQTYLIEPPEIQHVLEGAVRPGHYRGVATVVLKLFNMVQPQIAVFGKKDYQQCRVLDNMVRQLDLPIEMVLAETVRAADGLALSSRNSYLNAIERAEVMDALARCVPSSAVADLILPLTNTFPMSPAEIEPAREIASSEIVLSVEPKRFAIFTCPSFPSTCTEPERFEFEP